MNCTSENTEAANGNNAAPTQQSQFSTPKFSEWLPGEIRARHLPLESEATPAEVIPWVHKFLRRHLESEIPEGYESHKPWKAILEDWHAFLIKLQQLENPSFPDEPISHQKNSSPENQLQSESASVNQQSPPENEVRTSDNEVRKCENEVIAGEKILASSENDSLQNTPTSPSPDADSKKQFAPKPSATSVDLEDADDEIEKDPDDEIQEDADDEQDFEDEEEDLEEDEENLLDLAEYLGNESFQAALDLREYLSGRSQLDKLEPRIQQILLRMMEDHKPENVAEVIAEPPPIGLGIHTSQAALYRFRDRYTKAKQQSQKDQHAKAVQDLLAKANDTDEAFQAAVQRVLKTRLLTVSSDPNSDLKSINSLISSLTKLRKQSLAERKQLHAEKTK